MKSKAPALLLAAALTIAGLAQTAESQEQNKTAEELAQLDRSLLFASNAEIAEGKVLAEEVCGYCHSVDGVTVHAELPRLAGQHVIYLYNEMQAYKSGSRSDASMSKAVQFLSDEAMVKVAAFYSNLAPTDITQQNKSVVPDKPAVTDPVQLGKAASAGCAGCHGVTGNSKMPGMPNLTAQSPEYFAFAMKAYKDGTRSGTMMSGFTASVSDDAIKNIGLFYALQTPVRTSSVGNGDAEAGAKAAEACAGCHGRDGNVKTDTPTLAGQDAAYLGAAIKAYAAGTRKHELMEGAVAALSDADIDALASFYAQQEPVTRKVHAPPTVAALIDRCDRCHGIGGNSPDPRIPSLAGQNEAYLARVIEVYGKGGRHNSIMSKMSEQLSLTDIKALAAHYASQKPKSIMYVELPCTAPASKK